MNTSINAIDIVLGCSFGDEGKGKVVYDLIRKNGYDLCIRFNGSGNAGHTIYHNNRKIVLHQLPIGILFPNVMNLISSDCLIHIEKLKTELEEIKQNGIDINGRLFISKACHIITDEAIEYDKTHNVIGTTNSGIGPTYANKMLRIGKRAEEFEKELNDIGCQLVNMRSFWDRFIVNKPITVLLEGAQGFELDINWTEQYPYCTSSTCTIAGAVNTGIPIRKIRNVYGTSKIYDTYVGAKQFQPSDDLDLVKIGDHGHEYGATTGRRRQCNYLNLDRLTQSLRINQCNICIINKVDVLEELGIYRIIHNNDHVNFRSMNEMKEYINTILTTIVDTIIYSSNPFTI